MNVQELARAPVVTIDQVLAAWGVAKLNAARLRACARHRLSLDPEDPARATCSHCGGSMLISDAAHYVAGYTAAGRPADEVWPGWSGR